MGSLLPVALDSAVLSGEQAPGIHMSLPPCPWDYRNVTSHMCSGGFFCPTILLSNNLHGDLLLIVNA